MIGLYIIVALLTFALMEVVTWLTHKFIMHGFLWFLLYQVGSVLC